jgi:thiopeptide-type bacteriocin biosynthesis protein
MQERRWISAHLFYHDDLTYVLLGWVQPLVEELRSQQLLEAYFFIRYWQGGPHIRLRLLPMMGVSHEKIKACIEEQAQTFLRRKPSTQVLNDQRYKEVTNHLEYLEYGKAEDVSLYPNNSLHYIPYVPEYEHYGGEDAMAVIEQQFAISSELVLDVLHRQDSALSQKTTQGLASLFLAMSIETREIEQLACMAEEYYHAWERIPAPVQERFTAQFARQYQQQRLKIHALLRHLWQGLQSDVPTDLPSLQIAAHWQTSLQELKRGLEQIEVQRPLSVNDSYHTIPPKTNIGLRCTHMHNNRLGLLLLEEAYVLYMLKVALHEAVNNQEILLGKGESA